LAREALGEHRYEEALEACGELLEECAEDRETRRLRDEVVEEKRQVERGIGEAQEALGAKQWTVAQERAGAVLKVNPAEPRALDLLRDAERGLAAEAVRRRRLRVLNCVALVGALGVAALMVEVRSNRTSLAGSRDLLAAGAPRGALAALGAAAGLGVSDTDRGALRAEIGEQLLALGDEALREKRWGESWALYAAVADSVPELGDAVGQRESGWRSARSDDLVSSAEKAIGEGTQASLDSAERAIAELEGVNPEDGRIAELRARVGKGRDRLLAPVGTRAGEERTFEVSPGCAVSD
jgi:hypothetical protein